MQSLTGTHIFTYDNEAWQREDGIEFLEHILEHIDEPDDNPFGNCDMIHTLYVCDENIQREIFGRTDGIVQYELRESLDEGAYGECFAVQLTKTTHWLAMKRIIVDLDDERYKKGFKSGEIKVWLQFHISNPAQAVVRPGQNSPCPHLYAVTYDGTSVEMFMDYIRGWTIKQLCKAGIRLNKSFSQMTVIALLELTCRSLSVLHEHRILHGDISPNNIMVSHDFLRVVIIDFGLSSVLEEGKEFIHAPNYPGSMYYMAPQAARNSHLDFKADVWGTMMSLFILLADGTPLLKKILPDISRQKDMRQIIKQFCDDQSHWAWTVLWHHIAEFELEDAVMKVVQRCLRCSHADRCTAEEAAEDACRILPGRQLANQPEIKFIRNRHRRLPVPGEDEREVLVVLEPVIEPAGDIPEVKVMGPGGDVGARQTDSQAATPAMGGGAGDGGALPCVVEEAQEEEEVEGAVGGAPLSKDEDHNDFEDEGVGEDIDEDRESQEDEDENSQLDF